MTKRKHVARHQGVSETLSGTMESLEKYSNSFEKLKEELRSVAYANSVGQNTISNLQNAIENKRDSVDTLKVAARAVAEIATLLGVSEELAKKAVYWWIRMETTAPFVALSAGKVEAFTQVFGSPGVETWNAVSLNTWFLAEKDNRYVATPVGKKAYRLRARPSLPTALISTMEASVPALTPALVADIAARRQTFEAGVQADFLNRLGRLPSPSELSVVLTGSVMKANSEATAPFGGV